MNELFEHRIVYPNDAGGVSVVVPVPDSGLSIHEVAQKSVPAGYPYKIVPRSDIPDSRAFRNAWVVDMSDPVWPRLEEDLHKILIKDMKVSKVIGPGELLVQAWLDDADGIVDVDSHGLSIIGTLPEVGDTFITSGNAYTVPPGTFISKNQQ